MLPQAGNPAVRQCVVAICLICLVQWDKRVITVGLLYPLHTIAWVGKYLLACLAHVFRCLGIHAEWYLIVFIASALTSNDIVVEAGCCLHRLCLEIWFIRAVNIDEEHLAHAAVGLYLAHHTTDAVAIVRVVLAVESHAIVAHGKQRTVLCHIPAHTLMSYGNESLCLILTTRLCIAIWHRIFREEDYWVCPLITIGRCLQHSA